MGSKGDKERQVQITRFKKDKKDKLIPDYAKSLNRKNYIFGQEAEEMFEIYINKKTKNNVVKHLTKDGRDLECFDFVYKRKKIMFELKKRRIPHNRHPTAIINKCKIDNYFNVQRKLGYKCYIYYLYQDGLFQIKVDERFLDFKIDVMYGQLVHLVPNNLLILESSIEDYEALINK